MCVCVCVCVRVHARGRAHVRACVCVCVCHREEEVLAQHLIFILSSSNKDVRSRRTISSGVTATYLKNWCYSY